MIRAVEMTIPEDQILSISGMTVGPAGRPLRGPLQMKVCVVSAHVETHAAVRNTLAPMGIWDVLDFASYQEARVRAGRRHFDLIIAECPRFTTLACNFVIERRRHDNPAPAVPPILVLMERATRADVRHFQDCGANAIVLRDIGAGGLADRVGKLLGLDSEPDSVPDVRRAA